MRYAYPADPDEAPDGVTVTCPDVPGMVSFGQTPEEALERASDALVSMLSFYVDDNQPLPKPSAASGRPLLSVAALEAAKRALHHAMIRAGVSNMALARMLGLDEKAVRRLRHPLHRSHIGAVETALRALGSRLEVTVRAA
jgi:antitoxin HicB